MNRHLIIAAMLSFTLVLDPRMAIAAKGIELHLVVKEEIVSQNAQGKKVLSLVEPTSVIPGDMIVYTTHYHNTGKETADNVVITTPIPKETALVNGSAAVENATVSYSIDGGNHFDAPSNLIVTESRGKTRPATANDYTHIRWQLRHLAPTAHGSVAFHAKVR